MSQAQAIQPSPRETLLPHIDKDAIESLPYPPHALPGARDVKTGFGIMRVYEWGPEQGRKALFIHGDTTPCLMFAKIAEGLVARGCRVLLFDLWGRGYSDTPLHQKHDTSLYTGQISVAISSSPIQWEVGTSFAIIAFSLGATIAMDFIRSSPDLVDGLVLLGPAGLLRSMPEGYTEDLFTNGNLTSADQVRDAVGALLGSELGNREQDYGLQRRSGSPSAETCNTHASFNIADIVQWQFDCHRGFVHSFVDTIRFGPLMNQHDLWIKASSVIKTWSPNHSLATQPNSRVLVVFGENDVVVVGSEACQDIDRIFGGSAFAAYRYVPGTHGFPYPNSDRIVEYVSDFWGL